MTANSRADWCALVAHRAARQLFYLLVLASIGLTGCGGCSKQTPAQQAAAKKKADEAKAAEEAKRKAEEEKKKPYEVLQLTPLLSENLIVTDEGKALRLAKPGHWVATVQPMKANLDNFEGRISMAAVDDKSRPLPLPHTTFDMVSSRPVVLAKSQPKRIEGELLAPPEGKSLRVSSELISSAAGPVYTQPGERWDLMPSHQYFLLVLAREPGRYGFLKLTDTVRAPYEDDGGTSQPHYRVVLADDKNPLPLPPSVLTWTSVAYVVWDQVNLDKVTPAQRQALIDWIHWGGRLVINGPDSLDDLRGSFLAPYLPADAGERTKVTPEIVARMSEYWGQRDNGETTKAIAMPKPWAAIALKPRPGATELPATSGLFYERAVGAGSIVVSAVQLSNRDLVNWPGFDGFLNAAVLRRSARQFRVESEGAWVGLQSIWKGHENRTRDAYFTTPLRWFARDAGAKANAREVSVDVQMQQRRAPWIYYGNTIPETELVVDRPGGLGGWSDFGPVSTAARDALTEAAGVRVPAASFVVICLAIYLVVLVPLNWMVFHALGRIEWAWISAPIIAIIGTLAVVRQAQLDIGFVRSHTEISLLEIQGDHPRGHLSRYTALYSSLSTTYDLAFEDPSAVAAPFAPNDSFEPRIGDRISTVAFEKQDQAHLRGVTISSASTQMVHSEQMAPLKGPIRMFTPSGGLKVKQVENKSGYNLSDAVVVVREVNDAGATTFRGYWLGELRNGAGAILPPLQPLTWKKDEMPFAAQRAKAAEFDYHKRLNVDPLLKLAFQFPPKSDPMCGPRDEYRLIARIDEVLPGAVASPKASQMAGTTVVLAHLGYGDFADPQLDANSPSDVMSDRRRNVFEEALEESPEQY